MREMRLPASPLPTPMGVGNHAWFFELWNKDYYTDLENKLQIDIFCDFVYVSVMIR